jgi:hypothetical protein
MLPELLGCFGVAVLVCPDRGEAELAKLDTLVKAPNWLRASSGARAATVRSG